MLFKIIVYKLMSLVNRLRLLNKLVLIIKRRRKGSLFVNQLKKWWEII